MAAACGLSPATVQRVWRAFGLQPHRTETFKLSSDPDFAEKVRDIVGLYLAPPDRALVLCVDEKTEMQALERTQPVLPMRPGQPERRTSDYVRHGTPRLFAALDVTGGQGDRPLLPAAPRGGVPRLPGRGRRGRAGRASRCTWSSTTPRSTRPRRSGTGSPKRPRYHLHFTPTASSWLNQVERWFALLTARQLQRGVHRSVEELEAAMLAYIERHNAEPKPFRWTRSADEILASVARFCSRTLAVHRPDLQRTSETHH